jgi:hypothetical protein
MIVSSLHSVLSNKHCYTYVRMHLYLKYALLCFKYAAIVDLHSILEDIHSSVMDKEPALTFL